MRSGWIHSLLIVACIVLSAGVPPQPAAAGAGLPPQLDTTPPKSGPSGDRMADTREGGESSDTSYVTYDLDVSVSQPCDLECPEGAQIEGEPPCVDGHWDEYNGGCASAGWTPISAQDGDCSVMCGRSCTYLYNGNSYRDTDWYEARAAGGPLTVTGTAEFPLQLILIYGTTNCASLQYIYDTGAPCEPVTLSWPFEAGQECWLYVAPSVYSGVPESDYILDVCGIAPLPAGACCVSGRCYFESDHMCAGTWLGPGTDCDPNPCVADPTAACCLANGTCEMLNEIDCGVLQGVWQGAGFDCDPNPCAGTPVEKTTWGRIKNLYH